MLRRVDHLARLGTTFIHLSGGEPMLHPDLDKIIARIREHGLLSGLLANEFLLGPKSIQKLNEAGLDHLQISIDNVNPDEVSKKSLKVLDKKLQHLARDAEFTVNINSVVGSDLERPEDAFEIAQRTVDLGFTSTVGVIHDHDGQLQPLAERHRRVYDQVNALGRGLFSFASHNSFQENMIQGLPTDWDCHAGSRYLYVCEDGLVHYCSQQRGTPGIPLARYTEDDLNREYEAEKSCAPYCTISCVHRTSWLDDLRENPRRALAQYFPGENGEFSYSHLPVPVKALAKLFMPGEDGRPTPAGRAAQRILGGRKPKEQATPLVKLEV
jgi:MoaA/NifB/PqqE/SkfB family radical SAM enzyme